MHLMYTVDANGKRLYTLKKIQAGEVTKSAHPARFSPDDKYSRYDCLVFRRAARCAYICSSANDGDRHRVTLKKRYGLLMTQISRSFRDNLGGPGLMGS